MGPANGSQGAEPIREREREVTKRQTNPTLAREGIKAVIRSDDQNRVESVFLPLTGDQWADLASREGKYLGVCCGSISMIRDELVSALRNGGWIPVDRLREIVRAATEHDGLFPKKGQNKTRNPWATIARVWAAVEPYAAPEPGQDALNPNSPAEAMAVISSLALQNVVDGVFEPTPKHATSCLHLARFAPAIKTLYARLAELWPGDFVGVALVRVESPDRIISTYGGPAMYPQPEDAEDTLAWWERSDPDIRNKVMFRPVLVTLERGLEFTDKTESAAL